MLCREKQIMAATETRQLLSRITASPDTFNGKTLIRKPRIPVERMLGLLAKEVSCERISADYPEPTREVILTCLYCAHAVTANTESLAMQS